jgi:hypothetical protein
MQPELTPVHIGQSEADDSISAVADLYFANLDMRDPDVLRRAYDEVVGSVPDEFKDLYAEAAGLGHGD